ncbi:MAG: hypothetical protein ACOX74_03360 [Lachnospiraceae bacterium]|jgi:hypothetical protein
MTGLLNFRKRMILFSRKNENWLKIVLRFIGFLIVFMYVNRSIGYIAAMSGAAVNILLALICSVVPNGLAVFIFAADVAVQITRASAVVGIIMVIVMIILYLLFLKFSAKEAIVLFAIPVLMHFHLEYLIPVAAGVALSPYLIIPAVSSFFMVRYVEYVMAAVGTSAPDASQGLSNIDLNSTLTAVTSVMDSLQTDKTIVLFTLVTVITVALMYFISRAKFDYSWYVAIGVGAAAELVFGFVLAGMLDVSLAAGPFVISVIVGAAIAAAVQFFECVADYRSKEYVQFKDDEYYYYVTAVPLFIADEEEAEKKRAEKREKQKQILEQKEKERKEREQMEKEQAAQAEQAAKAEQTAEESADDAQVKQEEGSGAEEAQLQPEEASDEQAPETETAAQEEDAEQEDEVMTTEEAASADDTIVLTREQLRGEISGDSRDGEDR